MTEPCPECGDGCPICAGLSDLVQKTPALTPRDAGEVMSLAMLDSCCTYGTVNVIRALCKVHFAQFGAALLELRGVR